MSQGRQIALLLLWTLCCALAAFGHKAAMLLMVIGVPIIQDGPRVIWAEYNRPMPLKALYWMLAFWGFVILSTVLVVRFTPPAWIAYLSAHNKLLFGLLWFPVAMLYVRNLIRLRRADGTQPEGGADPA